MGFKCGIVGLPNVGKSTLFNALTATQSAEAANYPFCTIEPNVGRVAVPDERLDVLAKIAGSAKIIPTQLEFVDIAGLVAGASRGEGLGNQFLGHIREVDAVAHVLRCFEDDDITHVAGSVDPIRDMEIIETELMLADLDSLEKRLPMQQKKAKGGDKEAAAEAAVMEPVVKALREGRPARAVRLDGEEALILKRLQLLTAKPVMFVCNVAESEAAAGNAHTATVEKLAREQGATVVVISAAIEAEVAQLSDAAEKQEFLETLGLKETGLARVIASGYALLDLVTFFTVGPKEAHAWTLHRGGKAPEAAGVIHTDFEKGFIRAETIAYPDYVACNGENGAKEAGKLRLEGKEYVVQDGDIFHFRFNV
ncbi:MAG: redox-regulated ATPase YchF [Reyranellaceae bacterium]